jgi:hypothetical protein
MWFGKLCLVYLLFTQALTAQKFEYQSSIGKFNQASSFYINAAGIIFITDAGTDEVISIDTLGVIIREIGGYGWSQSAFDNPVDVFADALKVFVADKNNHRIQRFDKNLNFNFAISTRNSDSEEERFGYPLSAVMSNQGDVFILDSENSRILKFDIFGKFIQNFGGYDYGANALENPKQLAVSMQNNIFVIDGDKILVYDQYGNSTGNIESNEELNGIRILFNWLIANSADKIFVADLRFPKFSLNEVQLTGIDEVPQINSALLFNDKLYVLTKNSILVFNRTQ